MRILFFMAACLFFTCVSAQDETWLAGSVVTQENKVVVGEILFHPQHDLLVIRGDDFREVMPAHRISSFRFFDKSANINRKFTSLWESEYSNEKKIYEVILYGEISVLRRAKSTFTTTSTDADGYNYYFLRNEKIINLRAFRNTAYPEMRRMLAGEEKRRHLNPNSMADAIRLIELYNSYHAGLVASR